MSAAGSDDWMQSSDDPGKRQLRPSEVPEYRVRPRDPEPGYGPMEGTGSGGSVGTPEGGWGGSRWWRGVVLDIAGGLAGWIVGTRRSGLGQDAHQPRVA